MNHIDIIDIGIQSIDSDKGWDIANSEFLMNLMERIKLNVETYEKRVRFLKLNSNVINIASLISSGVTSILSYKLNTDSTKTELITLNVLSTVTIVINSVITITSLGGKIDDLQVSITRLRYILNFIELQFHTKMEDRIDMNQLLHLIIHERNIIEIKLN